MAKRIKLLEARKDARKSGNHGQAQAGWHKRSRWDIDNIRSIIDTEGAAIERDITSYPTLIGRMFHFNDAFENVLDNLVSNRPSAYHKSVSQCLDMWEILFRYQQFEGKIEIDTWEFAHLDNLLRRSSLPQHSVHLADSLEIFLTNDTFIRERISKIYLIYYKEGNQNEVIAGSSPYTGFFTSPNPVPFNIQIPNAPAGDYFFQKIRSLTERSTDFQYYMRSLRSFSAFSRAFPALAAYVDRCNIHLPGGINDAEAIQNRYNQEYLPVFDKYGAPVQLLDRMNEGVSVRSINIPVPNDFFGDYLIQLPYPIDDARFYTFMDKPSSEFGFLPPLKPRAVTDAGGIGELSRKFKMVLTTGANGYIKITASIRLMIAGEERVFTKEYEEQQDITLSNLRRIGKGHLVKGQYSNGYDTNFLLYPFVKYEGFNDRFMVTCLDGATNEEASMSLAFYEENGTSLPNSSVQSKEKIKKSPSDFGITVYSVAGNFGYFDASITFEQGMMASGLVVPKWPSKTGTTAFSVAVDFGTSNTYVAMKKTQGGDITSLSIKEEELQIVRLDKIPSSKDCTNDTDKYDEDWIGGAGFIGQVAAYQRRELLPSIIQGRYRFPVATAIAERKVLEGNAAHASLWETHHIPFAGLLEPHNMSNIYTNLKWSEDPNDRIRTANLLRELLLLVRNSIILKGGDPKLTTLYWFYPISMAAGIKQHLEQLWSELSAEVLKTSSDRVPIPLSESETPYYMYNSKGGNKGAHVDIGGGTSDFLIFERDMDNKTNEKIKLASSSTFAGWVLFGTYNNFKTREQKMDNGYVKAFKDKIYQHLQAAIREASDRKAFIEQTRLQTQKGVLDAYFKEERRAEDIIALFFSLGLGDLIAKNHANFKFPFLLFFSAIQYHLAQICKERKDIGTIDAVCFSGNGSRFLNALGVKLGQGSILEGMTNYIFKAVLGQNTPLVRLYEIGDRPKEATCEGALHSGLTESQLIKADGYGVKGIDQEKIKPITGERFEGDKKPIKFGDLVNIKLSEASEYKTFVETFFKMYNEMKLGDHFLVKLDQKQLEALKTTITSKSGEYFTKTVKIQTDDKGRKAEDPLNEPLFFYPVMGAVHDSLNFISDIELGAKK